MNKVNSCSLFLIFLISCNFRATNQRFNISELLVGYTSYDAFKADKKDSMQFIPPPPSPFEENIANNNIIESKEGKLFFYSFPKKESICGYMTQNGNYKFELYLPQLNSLKEADLLLIDSNNIDSVFREIINSEKPIYLSIGLAKEKSENKTLIKFVNKLYQNSINNTWKIRRLNKKEIELTSNFFNQEVLK